MPRRCTTIFLMMAYLASQLAVVPHVHGASGVTQHSDHDARSHIHVGWLGHGDHVHKDAHSHHHRHDGNHSPPCSDSNGEQDQHDSDAVYLAGEAGAASVTVRNVVSQASLAVGTFGTVAIIPATTTLGFLAGTLFPDKCSSGCPLYLALRALRI